MSNPIVGSLACAVREMTYAEAALRTGGRNVAADGLAVDRRRLQRVNGALSAVSPRILRLAADEYDHHTNPTSLRAVAQLLRVLAGDEVTP